jgi:hypothetical protein
MLLEILEMAFNGVVAMPTTREEIDTYSWTVRVGVMSLSGHRGSITASANASHTIVLYKEGREPR